MQVQDEAAGLVVALLDPQPGDNILDACAAPGGKTLFMAARMQGRVSWRVLLQAQGHLTTAMNRSGRLSLTGELKGYRTGRERKEDLFIAHQELEGSLACVMGRMAH